MRKYILTDICLQDFYFKRITFVISQKNAIWYVNKGRKFSKYDAIISLAGLWLNFPSKYYSINRFISISDIRLTGVFNISSYGDESGI